MHHLSPLPPGGVYLDLDTECFRNMEDSLRGGWRPGSGGVVVVAMVAVVVMRMAAAWVNR